MRSTHTRLLTAALGLLLTGCMTQVNQQGSLQSGQAAQPRSIVVINRPTGPRLIHKIIPAGQTIAVAGGAFINPDCSSQGPVTLKVVQPPVHGNTEIVKRKEFGHFPRSNPNYACNKQHMEGTYVDYTPDDGFTGSDFLVVDSFFGGVELEEKISIDVK